MSVNKKLIVFLFILITFSCLNVYIIPIRSGQSIDGSFDSYGYALGMEGDADALREVQKFLYIYPVGLPAFKLLALSAVLNFILLLPIIYGLYKTYGEESANSVLLAICLPESIIFLGCVSKEGLAIVACLSMFLAHILFHYNNIRLSFFAFIYSVILSEISRPWFSAIVVFSGFLALLPIIKNRKIRGYILSITLLLAPIYIYLIYKYGIDSAVELFDKGKDFLGRFETEMASESAFKNNVRKLFADPLLYGEITAFNILYVGILNVVKTAVYTIALPVISLPGYRNLPAQIWACCWQIAVTSSSLVVICGLLGSDFKRLTPIQISHYVFSISLMFFISISTLIFHVRYRAPAAVILSVSFFLVLPRLKKLIYPILITYFAVSVYVLIKYS